MHRVIYARRWRARMHVESRKGFVYGNHKRFHHGLDPGLRMSTAKMMTLAAPEPDRVVSRAWVQVTAMVLLVGLAILGFLGFRAYDADPPVPAQTRTTSGHVVFTGAEVIAGQKLFLRKG